MEMISRHSFGTTHLPSSRNTCVTLEQTLTRRKFQSLCRRQDQVPASKASTFFSLFLSTWLQLAGRLAKWFVQLMKDVDSEQMVLITLYGTRNAENKATLTAFYTN